jgi:sugar phosphate isomerase/epimerase
MNQPPENLPVVGAAMPIELLPVYRNWLLEDNRDLEIQDPFRPEFLDGDWEPAVQQVKATLDGFTGRVGIHGPFDGLALMSFDPKVRALSSDRLCQALEFAGAIHATHMVVHSPITAFGHPFVPYQPAYKISDLFARVHQTLEKPLKMAEAIGCTLVMENIQDLNPTLWVALVRSFKSDFVRASVDVGHAFIMHQYGGASPDAFVREAGSLLGHLHLQDTDGLTDRHWQPGKGNLNWYALFDALKSSEVNGAKPRLIIEVRDYDDIAPAAAYFKQQGLAT